MLAIVITAKVCMVKGTGPIGMVIHAHSVINAAPIAMYARFNIFLLIFSLPFFFLRLFYRISPLLSTHFLKLVYNLFCSVKSVPLHLSKNMIKYIIYVIKNWEEKCA